MNDNLARVLALLKVERELNKNMSDFGFEGLITIHEVTRNMPKELRQECYDLLDKLEAAKNKNIPD